MDKVDYNTFIKRFSVDTVKEKFYGHFESGINACEELCDRYAQSSKIALRYERADGSSGELSYRELLLKSAQFANFLQCQGIGKGDRVACLLPRSPELVIVLLGTLRAGAIYQPFFTAFGSGAIEYRLHKAQSKLLVSNATQWPKLADINELPKTLLVGNTNSVLPKADYLFSQELEAQSDDFKPVKLHGNDAYLQMFTSGTTGKPKGVTVPLKGLMLTWCYMTYAVDLHSDDRYWNLADPGWAYGLYFGVIGPLLLGCTVHLNEHGFTAENTLDFIKKYRINNLAAAPTAYRELMAKTPLLKSYSSISLRAASSAGEPLNREIIDWVRNHLHCDVCDHYGSTETGITSANFHAFKHKRRDACMGYPMPGFRLVALDSTYQEVPAGQSGELAIDREHSPLHFFEGYSFAEKNSLRGKYYMTGDMVINNGDGSHSYTGRDDDIIASAGYRIGPADIEGYLLEHPAVIESAAVGKPDKKRGFIVKAYVVIQEDYEADQALIEEMQQHIRTRLSAHAVPREIEFLAELPKNPSGKLQRFILRQRAAHEVAS